MLSQRGGCSRIGWILNEEVMQKVHDTYLDEKARVVDSKEGTNLQVLPPSRSRLCNGAVADSRVK
jgi:hypothetical protein